MIYFLWILAIWSVLAPLALATYTRHGDKINVELEIAGDEYAKLFVAGPAVWLILIARMFQE